MSIDKLYCKLNRVTALWRHQGRVNKKDMDNLCNAQVDYDEEQRKLKHSPMRPCLGCGEKEVECLCESCKTMSDNSNFM